MIILIKAILLKLLILILEAKAKPTHIIELITLKLSIRRQRMERLREKMTLLKRRGILRLNLRMAASRKQ